MAKSGHKFDAESLITAKSAKSAKNHGARPATQLGADNRCCRNNDMVYHSSSNSPPYLGCLLVTLSLNSGNFKILWLFMVNLSAAAEQHDHQPLKQDAHLHGYVELTAVMEGGNLEINIESPAANIIGFEHRPTSSEQLQTIALAKQVLESPAELFTFSGSDCSPTLVRANFLDLISDDQNDGHHHEHQGNKQSHSEVIASYQFACVPQEKLKAIRVNLISLFPGIKKIKAMWLTDTKQGAVALTPEFNLIEIR